MPKTKRPALRPGQDVTLASHTRMIPAHDGKPHVLRDTVLRVSSILGTGSNRSPWSILATDGTHFWHLDPADVTPTV